MSSLTVSDVKLQALESTCRVRLAHVIFPLEFRDLRDVLARNGYELVALPGPIPPAPTRIVYTGEIARKEQYTVHIDSSAGLVGVNGRSMTATYNAFEELSKIVMDNFGVSLGNNVHYHEIIAHYNARTGKNAILQIGRQFEDSALIHGLGKVLGKTTSMYSIRLAPKGDVPNQEEWYDISIDPDVLKPETYHVGIIFRSPRKEEIASFAINLEETIGELLRTIEK